jgi:hydrogenase maturation protein HypF
MHRRFQVIGTVQGVGFRPFVYRLATSLGISGSVRNSGGVVLIDAAGDAMALAEFVARLGSEAPPLASVTTITEHALSGLPPAGFTVEASDSRASVREIPPDAATCDACLTELFDPADRRYRYPFINCVDCGPRATIISGLPYDRARTTMAGFAMCAACAAEYNDPADRRFHAEPVACPECGPRLRWGDAEGEDAPPASPSPFTAAVTTLDNEGIIALKGLGGYQLVCDATSEVAVALLRDRKHRPSKPMAVMVADLDAALRLASLSAAERELLGSPARPIVLARTSEDGLAPAVRAGAPYLGVMLPVTPLHHLIAAEMARPLVVTSGNLSDEPIIIDDETARRRLPSVADGVLGHDREILSRHDDSVAWVVKREGEAGGVPAILRRARGYAPAPLRLPVPAAEPVLAVGAQLKHTFALADAGRIIVGPHTGDLADAETMDAFSSSLRHLSRVHNFKPAYVAHDLHPEYLSTKYATRFLPSRRIAVQHHHAHIASCAAEHGLTGQVIGVAYDGLGLGDDGTFWGGEVVVADLVGYRRVARFGRAPMPGGTAAIRRPARMALGYLVGAEDLGGGPGIARAFPARLTVPEAALVRRMIAGQVNSPLASSAGRLFDAAASLLGLRDTVSYEGEAALALEAAATQSYGVASTLPWRTALRDGLLVYDPRPTLAALAEDNDVPALAAAFHATIAEVTVALVRHAAKGAGHLPVCLSGGVWQNRLLAESAVALLCADGFDVFTNERVPTNDGGISYGQAAVAAARLTCA